MLKLFKKQWRHFLESPLADDLGGTIELSPADDQARKKAVDAARQEIQKTNEDWKKMEQKAQNIDKMPPGHKKDSARKTFLKELEAYNKKSAEIKSKMRAVLEKMGEGDIAKLLAIVQMGLIAWREGGSLGMPFRVAASRAKYEMGTAMNGLNEDMNKRFGLENSSTLSAVATKVALGVPYLGLRAALQVPNLVRAPVAAFGAVTTAIYAFAKEGGNVDAATQKYKEWIPEDGFISNSMKSSLVWNAMAGIGQTVVNLGKKSGQELENAVTGRNDAVPANSDKNDEESLNERNMTQPGMHR